MKSFLLASTIFVLTIPFMASAYTSPGKPQGYVSDFAHVLQASDIQYLNDLLSATKNSLQLEMAIVTIPALGDETIETYAVKLFQEWGIGAKGKDDGILILVAPNDHQARIEVGYGLEGAVTDLQAGNIVSKVMIPAFKINDYSGGIKGAVAAVIGIVSKSPEAALFSEPAAKQSSSKFKVDLNFIFFILFIVFGAVGRLLSKTKSWWLGGVLGAGAGAIIGLIWGFLYYGIVSIIGLSAIGLVFDYIVSKKGSGGKDGHGGFWFGPGLGGGSGSGGFGGFGGGMSGGGGASGRW